MTVRILDMNGKYAKIDMNDKMTTISECDVSGKVISDCIPHEFGMFNESSKAWIWTSEKFEKQVMRAVKKGKYVDN